MHVHDLIGIGFGPSNIALAIALDEQRPAGRRYDALFIERRDSFAWHPEMLLEQAQMQISFLKDLVSLRNPTSRYSFVNYLHEHGRLQDFINLKTFHPSRHEFSDYLGWAAAQFEGACAYGEDVLEVLPERSGGEVGLLRVRSRDASGASRERLARNLVLSLGGVASVPDVFRPLHADPRVLHSSGYLRDMPPASGRRRVAIIGGGQSAAEIFMDLHGRAADTELDLILRARTLRPSDDSPFVNQIFDADFVDHIYARPESERQAMLREFRHTNYACPDLALIEQIFRLFYEQKVRGQARHRYLPRREIQSARAAADGIHLSLLDVQAHRESSQRYDAVVLATGYERRQHHALLAPLAPYLGDCVVDRGYRVRSAPNFRPAVYLQGACEDSHGLSDTLLSITAVRTGEIGRDLLACATQGARERVAA